MIIFLRTRHEYHSYSDWFKLAELSGYSIRYLDEIETFDAPDNVYIIAPVSGEWRHWPKGYTQGRMILYQLEHNIDGEHFTPEAVSEVWAGDKWQADKCGFRYVPMGSHEGLGRNMADKHEKIYDVSQIAYQTYRRQNITRQLLEAGLRLSPNENLWNFSRSLALVQSEIMLHVHQWDNIPAIAPLRWCLAAAHHLPIVSEQVADRGIFGYTHMMQADYEHLPRFVSHVLKDPRLLADYAAALHTLLCHEWTFKHMVEASV